MTASSETVTGHVFVSYVREDSNRVDWLCQVLESAGISVWRDTTQLWPGEDWRAVIRRAIRADALVFLACFSSQSIGKTRSYQNEEIVLAIEEIRMRPPDRPWLIPVRFDDSPIPDWEIGGGRMLSDLQQADLFGDNRQQNVDRLVAAIRRILSRGSAQPAPAPATTDPAPAATDPAPRPSSSPKYVINLDGAQGIQIGDGNIQHNTFGK
jgi:TIR domain/RIP homotypic interaction motif